VAAATSNTRKVSSDGKRVHSSIVRNANMSCQIISFDPRSALEYCTGSKMEHQPASSCVLSPQARKLFRCRDLQQGLVLVFVE